MQKQASTSIIVLTAPNVFGALHERFAASLRARRDGRYYRLPHPEVPMHPLGTTHESVLRALAHRSHRLAPIRELTPQHLRTMRDVNHRLRTSRGRLIVIGLLDEASPFGARRGLEAIVRSFIGQPTAVTVIPLYWHLTPSELSLASAEIQHLSRPNIQVVAPLALEEAGTHTFRSRFLDSLSDRTLSRERPLNERDVVLIANHHFHGMHAVTDLLTYTTRATVATLPIDLPLDERFSASLQKYQPLRISYVAPHHGALVAGNVEHPYLERFQFEDAEALLGVHLSPHFGDSPTLPHRDMLIIPETRNQDFDRLLASYLKSIGNRPYYICFTQPQHPHGHTVISNAAAPDHTIHYETLAAIV